MCSAQCAAPSVLHQDCCHQIQSKVGIYQNVRIVCTADLPAVSAQIILLRIDQTDRIVKEKIDLIVTTMSTAVTAEVSAALQSIEE